MTTALTFPNASWRLVAQIEGFSHTVLSVFRAKIRKENIYEIDLANLCQTKFTVSYLLVAVKYQVSSDKRSGTVSRIEYYIKRWDLLWQISQYTLEKSASQHLLPHHVSLIKI